MARNQASLKKEHLAFFDWDSIYWELQDYKNDRAWFNLNLERDNLVKLLLDDSWYTLLIPPDELVPTRFDRVRLWQEIAVALLKKYANAFYLAKKSECGCSPQFTAVSARGINRHGHNTRLHIFGCCREQVARVLHQMLENFCPNLAGVSAVATDDCNVSAVIH